MKVSPILTSNFSIFSAAFTREKNCSIEFLLSVIFYLSFHSSSPFLALSILEVPQKSPRRLFFLNAVPYTCQMRIFHRGNFCLKWQILRKRKIDHLIKILITANCAYSDESFFHQHALVGGRNDSYWNPWSNRSEDTKLTESQEDGDEVISIAWEFFLENQQDSRVMEQ